MQSELSSELRVGDKLACHDHMRTHFRLRACPDNGDSVVRLLKGDLQNGVAVDSVTKGDSIDSAANDLGGTSFLGGRSVHFYAPSLEVMEPVAELEPVSKVSAAAELDLGPQLRYASRKNPQCISEDTPAVFSLAFLVLLPYRIPRYAATFETGSRSFSVRATTRSGTRSKAPREVF